MISGLFGVFQMHPSPEKMEDEKGQKLTKGLTREPKYRLWQYYHNTE